MQKLWAGTGLFRVYLAHYEDQLLPVALDSLMAMRFGTCTLVHIVNWKA